MCIDNKIFLMCTLTFFFITILLNYCIYCDTRLVSKYVNYYYIVKSVLVYVLLLMYVLRKTV